MATQVAFAQGQALAAAGDAAAATKLLGKTPTPTEDLTPRSEFDTRFEVSKKMLAYRKELDAERQAKLDAASKTHASLHTDSDSDSSSSSAKKKKKKEKKKRKKEKKKEKKKRKREKRDDSS